MLPMRRRFSFLFLVFITLAPCSMGCAQAGGAEGNRTDRLEWFRDQGFGMFIHLESLNRARHESSGAAMRPAVLTGVCATKPEE